MNKRILNQYRFEEKFIVGICSDGKTFIFDYDDYERIKNYTWRIHKKSVYTNITRGNPISLSRFVLNISGNRRVFARNGDSTDCRKENLYCGNIFSVQNNYYNVECFDGQTFKIDLDDYEKVKKHIWHIDKGGYVITKSNGKTFKLHRYLLDILSDNKFEVDHINRDKADNRKQNLRLSDRSGNCINKKFRNKSGMTGVYWNKSIKKWCVQISKDSIKYYLGSYDNFEEACRIRRDAEIKYHKEFSPNN